MRRGDVCLVSLDPVQGSEADKSRPAILVSNDGANRVAERLGRGVVTVVPVTSNVQHIYPFQVLLPMGETGLRRDSKAQAEQVRSVDTARIGPVVARLSADLLDEVGAALRLHLGL